MCLLYKILIYYIIRFTGWCCFRQNVPHIHIQDGSYKFLTCLDGDEEVEEEEEKRQNKTEKHTRSFAQPLCAEKLVENLY